MKSCFLQRQQFSVLVSIWLIVNTLTLPIYVPILVSYYYIILLKVREALSNDEVSIEEVALPAERLLLITVGGVSIHVANAYILSDAIQREFVNFILVLTCSLRS